MEVHREKPGRKPTGRLRDANIQLRVTDSELEVAKRLAAERGTTISRALREYLLASEWGSDRPVSVTIKDQKVTLTKEEAKLLLRQLTDVLIR